MEASSSGPFSLSRPLPLLSLSYTLRSSRTPADAHKRRALECAAPGRSARRACRWERSRRLSSDSSLGAAWGYYHSLGFLLALNTKQITPATPPSPFHSALVSHLTHKHCSHTHFSRLRCFSFPPSSLWIYNLVVSCNIFFSRLPIQTFLFM